MADDDVHDDGPAWRERALSRSMVAARSRAEQRIQKFLDAAFSLIDEKGTTDFTIQEVIDRSGQSLRSFYQYFDGKDELLLALFEESVRESIDDLRALADADPGADPLARLEACAVRLHEWCDPSEQRRGTHDRSSISEFSVQLAVAHPERVTAIMAPVGALFLELVDAAAAAGRIQVADTRHAAALIQQTVMFSWFGNRIVRNPRLRVSSGDLWQFCLRGLGG